VVVTYGSHVAIGLFCVLMLPKKFKKAFLKKSKRFYTPTNIIIETLTSAV